jgi:hypothetical protein
MENLKSKQLYILLGIVLSLALIGGVNAVTINSGTSFITSSSKLNITFNQVGYADLIDVESTNITFLNYSLDQNNTVSFIVNETQNYTSSALPYVSGFTVVSGLNNTRNTTVVLYPYICHKIFSLTNYTYSCINNQITIFNFPISNGINPIPITYIKSSCQTSNDIINAMVVLIPLIIVIVIFGLIFSIKNGTFSNIAENPQSILYILGSIIFLALILGIGLVVASQISC